MIPEHFYITDLGLMVYGCIVVPSVFVVSVLLLKKFTLSWTVIAPIALVLLTLPFWDVYMIGKDADQLCKEQGGLHVYKTETVDGFRGVINNWEKYGFKYVEDFGIGPDKYNKKFRYSMKNGKEVVEEIPEYTTRYGIKGKKFEVIDKYIGKNSIGVADLSTGEILGELAILNIHPGRFDGFLLKLTGSGPVVWHCGDESSADLNKKLTFQDVVLATLKPKKFERKIGSKRD